MNWKNLLYGILGCLLLTACYDEDPLTADVEEGGGLLRFEFPQGVNSWDDDIKAIQEKFGVYVIYKDIDSSELNRSWTGTLMGTQYYGGSSTDEQAEYVVNFLKNHIFANLTPEITERVLPMYWFIVYDSHTLFDFAGIMTLKMAVQYRYDGLDFWSMCWFYGDPDPMYGGIETPESAYDFWKERETILWEIMERSFNQGNIAIPEGFSTGFDYETEIVNGTGHELDANYYVMRGFPGRYYGPTYNNGNGFYQLNRISDITPEENFLEYIYLCMWKTEEDLNEKWPKNIYTFLWEKRAYVIDYMKSTYGIDLEAIARGPEM